MCVCRAPLAHLLAPEPRGAASPTCTVVPHCVTGKWNMTKVSVVWAGWQPGWVLLARRTLSRL